MSDDVTKLADAVTAAGLDLSARGTGRGWATMGAILTDAVLQRRNRYDAVVLPRARAVEALGLNKTSDVMGALDGESLWAAFSHHAVARRTQFAEMARALDAVGVQTVQELAEALSEKDSRARASLSGVKNVGPKTMAYLPILCGADGVAIDVHLRNFAIRAGLAPRRDAGWVSVYEAAAVRLGVEVGVLDRAVWRHMSATRARA